MRSMVSPNSFGCSRKTARTRSARTTICLSNPSSRNAIPVRCAGDTLSPRSDSPGRLSKPASPDDRLGDAANRSDQRHLGGTWRTTLGYIFDTAPADRPSRLGAIGSDRDRRRYDCAALYTQRRHHHAKATSRCWRAIPVSRLSSTPSFRTASCMAT